jgi:dihydrofolate synthase/folylpolyglutamate synthase
VAVLEVGLGGRLDSTNVCHPLLSVITNISRDHTRQLGNTLAKIAREKAGIIKPGVPVISGETHSEPRIVIEHTARQKGCRLIQAGRDFEFRYRPPQPTCNQDVGDLNGPDRLRGQLDYDGIVGGSPTRYRHLDIGLAGRHQAANAAIALTVLELLRQQEWSIPQEAIRRALADVRCPARVELIARRPAVILDAAHNDASVAALVETLRESFPQESFEQEAKAARENSRRILVFASSQDKDVPAMLRLLLPQFDQILLTRYLGNPRSVPPEQLREIANEIAAETNRAGQATRAGDNGAGGTTPNISAHADPAAVVAQLRSSVSPNDCVCITGSFFIAAEMRSLLSERPLGAPAVR